MIKSNTPNVSLRYRADIDGLRAFAVLAVIAFHVGFNGTSGGFVGVDIFFVISGYLITGIIEKDLNADTFSVAAFYERRVRRILPAFVVVLVFTTLLAYRYLLPADTIDYGWSLAATAFSASNFYFLSKSGYFESSGPLLHTWSLSVEEQFYIFFPLMMALFFRYRRSWLHAGTLLLALLSLAVSVACERQHPSANFYLPFTRAWELLIGSLLSFRMLPVIRHRLAREVCAFTGLGLVLFAVFKYTSNIPFPGLSALPPCLGAALIIYSGEQGVSLVGQVLSFRPLVFLGGISYSLYLWHWPFLQFGQYGFLHANSLSHRENVAVYLAVCIGVSVLSWRFVEQPFRQRNLRLPRRILFSYAGCVLLILCVTGGVMQLHRGLSFRYPPAALAIAAQAEMTPERKAHFREGKCFLLPGETLHDFDQGVCLRSDPSHKAYLLLGDSHAAAIWQGLASNLPEAKIMQATSSNCKPFPNESLYATPICHELMSFIFDQYLPQHHVDAVLLEARWKARDLPRIADLVQHLRSLNIPVAVLGPAEEYDAPLPILLAYAIRSDDPDMPYKHRLVDLEALDRTMQQQAKHVWHVPYISLIQADCVSTCQVYADASRTIPQMFDHDHYTTEGATSVIAHLLAQDKLGFEPAVQPPAVRNP
jgi:peptidoglycan/LPS O-acetylase OafA/YrhL